MNVFTLLLLVNLNCKNTRKELTIATERTMCCILENYRREHGVEIPDVLRPYIGGKTFMPFQAPPAKEAKGKFLELTEPEIEVPDCPSERLMSLSTNIKLS
ncbi:Serine--tRNA ligase, cytoplasmic [Capsicum chinense]|nr:Serine--tRNA ligase, cytoplasmic [Capsicum chinense]